MSVKLPSSSAMDLSCFSILNHPFLTGTAAMVICTLTISPALNLVGLTLQNLQWWNNIIHDVEYCITYTHCGMESCDRPVMSAISPSLYKLSYTIVNGWLSHCATCHWFYLILSNKRLHLTNISSAYHSYTELQIQSRATQVFLYVITCYKNHFIQFYNICSKCTCSRGKLGNFVWQANKT